MRLLFSLAILLRCVGTCARGNSCWHTSMTCTSFQSQTAPAHFMTCWLTGWLHTMGQLHEGLARGTLQESAQLGPDVWIPCGVKILGTPIGTDDFVQTKIESRLEDERSLWEAVSWVLDLQCAWQILLQCASPRCATICSEKYHQVRRHGMPTATTHDGNHGGVARRSARSRGAEDVGSEDRDYAHAHGRIKFVVCDPHVPCSALGLVGRCAPHDLSTTFRGGERHRQDAWPSSRVQPMTWIGAVSCGDPVGKR